MCIRDSPNNLLIILNDNDMAIDHSVGGLSQYLVDITTSQAYNKMRYDEMCIRDRFMVTPDISCQCRNLEAGTFFHEEFLSLIHI